jgi:hypothetical protein
VRRRQSWFSILTLSVILSVGGGNYWVNGSVVSAGSENESFLNLGLGVPVDVSSYNGKNIYTLFTGTPGDKSEHNSNTVMEAIGFSLISTAGAATVSSVWSDIATNTDSQMKAPAQTIIDKRSREKERLLLARQTRQFSRADLPPTKTLRTGQVGATWNNVYVYDVAGQSGQFVTIDTTCRFVSQHACFYVDNNNQISDATLAEYGNAFDQIYLVNQARFGRENDTDGNGKVNVVFSGKLTNGVIGYFNPEDKYAYLAGDNYSNEGDIIYVTTDTKYRELIFSEDVIKGALAHEFQHMIYFDEHYNRGALSAYTWLNEALSQAAEYYNGYIELHLSRIANFLKGGYRGLSLTHWAAANYGYGAIFIRYIIEKYGDAAVKKMCATPYVGIKAVEAATGVDFNTLFTNFTRALVFLGTNADVDPLDNFTGTDLTALQASGRGGLLPLSDRLTAGISGSGVVPPYGFLFYRWRGTFGTMTLSGLDITGSVFGLRQ